MMWLFVGLLLVAIAVTAVRTVRPKAKSTIARSGDPPGNVHIEIAVRSGRTTAAAPLRWHGSSAVLQVGPFQLTEPLTYTYPAQSHACDRSAEPSAIDPTLPVGRVPSASAGRELPYWPAYSQLSAAQRHTYLRWMAERRISLPPEDGYLFIFYYGLERRALVDRQDIDVVLREVRRLRLLHLEADEGRSGSFQRYSSGFIWLLVASAAKAVSEDTVRQIADETRWWSDENLAAVLSWVDANDRPLPLWLARIVARQAPGAQRSVVARRVSDEFERLFARRYADACGDGMRLNVAGRQRLLAYQPASAALSPVTCNVANPVGVPGQFTALAEMWNGCIDDLRKYSRRAGTEGRQLTPDAWEALPQELRAGIDHPLTSNVCALVNRHSKDEGYALVGAGDSGAAIGLEFRDCLTARQSRTLVETFEHIGYAIEPDARLTGRSYQWRERFAVFLRLEDQAVDSTRYNAAACLMHLGLHVAQADETVNERELALVTTHIEEAFDLNEHECRRLEALRQLLLSEGADLAGVGQRVAAAVPDAQREQIGRLLVAVAAADGVVTHSEVRALRGCYRALSLTPEAMEAALAELAPDTGETTVVIERRVRRLRRGEPIPPPPEAAAHERRGVSLDRQKIATILAETREVAALLAEVMNVREPGPPSDAPGLGPGAATQPGSSDVIARSGPPSRYAGFYSELTTQESWSADAADGLARRHGLMLHAALEEINDWAYDALGAPVAHCAGQQIEVDLNLVHPAQGGTQT